MTPLIHRKRRKESARKSVYQTLIGTPEILVGGASPVASSFVKLPAAGYLAISHSVAVTAGELVSNTSRGKILGTVNLNASELHRIGWFERDVDINLELTSAVPGTATLYYLDAWRRPYQIASAIFT